MDDLMRAMFLIENELVEAIATDELVAGDTIQVLFSKSIYFGEPVIIDWYKNHLEMIMIHAPQANDDEEFVEECRAIMKDYLADRPNLVEMKVYEVLNYIDSFKNKEH